MDIKEVTKRVEKAFPGWKTTRIDRAYVTENKDYYKQEAWQIVIYDPKKDDKK